MRTEVIVMYWTFDKMFLFCIYRKQFLRRQRRRTRRNRRKSTDTMMINSTSDRFNRHDQHNNHQHHHQTWTVSLLMTWRIAYVVLSYRTKGVWTFENLSSKSNRIDRQTFKQFEQLTNFSNQYCQWRDNRNETTNTRSSFTIFIESLSFFFFRHVFHY